MIREAATIRSRDLDQDIITSHIWPLRDQLADEISAFQERSAPTADGAMIVDIAAHSLATAVFAALEELDEQSRTRHRRPESPHRQAERS